MQLLHFHRRKVTCYVSIPLSVLLWMWIQEVSRLGVVTDSTTMNTHIRPSVLTYRPGHPVTGPHGCVCSALVGASRRLSSLYSHQQHRRALVPPHPRQHLIAPVFFPSAIFGMFICITFHNLLQDRLGTGNRRKVSRQFVFSKMAARSLPSHMAFLL